MTKRRTKYRFRKMMATTMIVLHHFFHLFEIQDENYAQMIQTKIGNVRDEHKNSKIMIKMMIVILTKYIQIN